MFSLCFVEINPDGYSLCPTASTEIATGTDATTNSTTHSNEITNHQESCLWPNALQVIFSQTLLESVFLLKKKQMCDIQDEFYTSKDMKRKKEDEHASFHGKKGEKAEKVKAFAPNTMQIKRFASECSLTISNKRLFAQTTISTHFTFDRHQVISS